MAYTRREFLGTVSTATAMSAVSCVSQEQVGEDPLGVRRDFDVIGESTYLDSPYITPSPRQAVEAVVVFNEEKGRSGLSWQQGYGCFSVSEGNADKVRQYILQQDSHHRKITFQEEYRTFLIRHGVEFDERYVWD